MKKSFVNQKMKNKSKRAVVCALFSAAFLAAAAGFASCKKDETPGNGADAPSGITAVAYLSEYNVTMKAGEKKTLTAGGGDVKNWQSSAPEIASVEGGEITAVKEGIAFIGVEVGGEKLVCVVNVAQAEKSAEITLSATSKTMSAGDNAMIFATASQGGNAADIVVSWSVSDPAVAEIVANGNSVNIAAKSAGTAIVTATFGSATSACRIMVSPAYDTHGTFAGGEEHAETAGSKITQNDFSRGAAVAKNEFDTLEEDHSSVKLSSVVYYGEYKNNQNAETSALAVYAALDETSREKAQTSDYYRYGFLVNAVQISGVSYHGYEGQTYAYYASQGNENGKFGLFIENIPAGYYKVRAFIEYATETKIALLCTENYVTAGDMQCTIAESVRDISVKIADGSRWGYGSPVPGEAANETLSDDNGRSMQAKYAFDVSKSGYRGANKYYYSPKLKINPRLTAEQFNEFALKGYSRFTFWVYYKTAETLSSSISFLDLGKFDGATLSDSDGSGGAMNGRLTSLVSAPTNAWVRVQYDSALIAKYYDVLFGWNGPYPLFHYASSASGVLYVSDFTMEKTLTADDFAADNLIATTGELGANFGNHWNPINGRAVLQAKKYAGTEFDGEEIKPAFEFNAPASAETLKSYESIAIFQKTDINKAVLEEYCKKGYTALEFYVMQKYSETHDMFLCTLDLAAINAENSDGDEDFVTKSDFNNIDRTYFTAYLPSRSGYKTNKWVKVSYDLAELIKAYDVVWETGTAWPLARFGGYRKTQDYTFYVSVFSLFKPISADDYDPAKVVTDATLFTAKRINYEWTSSSLQNNVVGVETVQPYGQPVSNRLDTSVSKVAAFKIDLLDGNSPWNNTVAFTLDGAFMTKEVLAQFIAKGYAKLQFAVYREFDMEGATWENGVGMRTIDFEKMRENNASVNDKDTAKSNYTAVTIARGTNVWHEVEYALADLLEFYDVLFAANTPYFLCEAGNYHSTAGAFYISEFSLSK